MDAWSYLPGSGDAYSRMSGNTGDAYARLPGTIGDTWTRLIASIGPEVLSCILGIIVDDLSSWTVITPASSCEVTLFEIKQSRTII